MCCVREHIFIDTHAHRIPYLLLLNYKNLAVSSNVRWMFKHFNYFLSTNSIKFDLCCTFPSHFLWFQQTEGVWRDLVMGEGERKRERQGRDRDTRKRNWAPLCVCMCAILLNESLCIWKVCKKEQERDRVKRGKYYDSESEGWWDWIDTEHRAMYFRARCLYYYQRENAKMEPSV